MFDHQQPARVTIFDHVTCAVTPSPHTFAFSPMYTFFEVTKVYSVSWCLKNLFAQIFEVAIFSIFYYKKFWKKSLISKFSDALEPLYKDRFDEKK